MRYVVPGLVALALTLAACSIDKERVLEARAGTESPQTLATRAESLFAATPRTPTRAQQAYRSMRDAAQGSEPGSRQRYEYLTDAAHFAIWAANHTDDDARQSDLAEQAITLCNTAIQADSNRVEGYFYRAVAIGLFAEENKLKGRSAMSDIREDARRAIALDATFSHGGPYRVLGTLYLRAPGPPTGIGSVRRALRYLKQAHEVAPTYPENILRLAEAYLEADSPEDAAALLDTFDEALRSYDGASLTEEKWREQAASLRRRLNASSPTEG